MSLICVCFVFVSADIDQIQLEAQHRWLRPAEICEILQNYQKFRITPEPPNRPPSMIMLRTSSCS